MNKDWKVMSASCRSLATAAILMLVLAGFSPLMSQSDLVFRKFASAPSSAGDTSLAMDEVRGNVVLFGGVGTPAFGSGLGCFGETWTLDGNKWHKRNPSTSPPARALAGMAWDPNTKSVLMFGGYDSNGSVLGDTWTWDGREWRQVGIHQFLAGTGPIGRTGSRLATDRIRNRVVMFGGDRTAGMRQLTLGDTWEWDGSQWAQCVPATRQPAGRCEHAFAWNAATGRVTMMGGFSHLLGRLRFMDVEEWDGRDWLAIRATNLVGSPAPLYMDADAVADPLGRGVFFHGDRYPSALQTSPSVRINGLWDGVRMVVQVPSASPPPGSMRSSLVAKGNGKQVLFYRAGQSAALTRAVWSMDPTDGAWSVAVPYPDLGVNGFRVSQAHVPWLDASMIQPGGTRDIWLLTESGYDRMGPGPTVAGGAVWVEFLVDANQRRIFGKETASTRLFELTSAGWVLLPSDLQVVPAMALVSNYDPAAGAFYHMAGQGANSDGVFRWSLGSTVRIGPRPTLPVPGPGLPLGKLVFDEDRDRLACVFWIPSGIGITEWDGQSWNRTDAAIGNFWSGGGWDAAWMRGRGIVLVTVSPTTAWSWDGSGAWTRLNSPGAGNSVEIGSICYDRNRARLRVNTLEDILVYDTYWDLLQEQLRVDDLNPHPGHTVRFSISSAVHQGQPWMLLLSGDTQPSIPLTGASVDPDRVLPLAFDDLLVSSLGIGLRGVLDAQGLGSATLTIPGDPALGGFAFHAAAVTITPQVQIGLVSNPVQVLVTR